METGNARRRFSAEIKRRKAETGITFEQLRDVTGIPLRTLQHIASGDVEPKLDRVACLCQHLRISGDYVMTGDRSAIRVEDSVIREIIAACERSERYKRLSHDMAEGMGLIDPTNPGSGREESNGV